MERCGHEHTPGENYCASAELIHVSYLNDELCPQLIQPLTEEVDLAIWSRDHRDFIEAQLSNHGAMLFRGFKINSVADFETAAKAICSDLYGEYEDLPKEKNSQNIYRSTPYPSDQSILFHNEASHMHRWPMKQWFLCMIPAELGGETPIVDCRRIYQRMNPTIVKLFKEKKLKYVRNFIGGMDVNWQSFFKTSDKLAVEAYCRANDIAYEWFGNARLRISQVCPGVARHPRTGEMVFFNQIQLHHISFLDPCMRQLIESSFAPQEYPRNVCYGDGTPIEDSVAREILRTYQDNAVSFSWQIGDILMVDNMLIAHGRRPFKGKRKVVVAMAEVRTWKDVTC